MANRPPAPLPDRPVEYVPDENYEDPDALERSREGSLASINGHGLVKKSEFGRATNDQAFLCRKECHLMSLRVSIHGHLT